MMPRVKRVAVAGGGPAGMMAIKSLKEEGLDPVCYEKSPYFGGTWCYHDDDINGLGSVMWSTVINHSKEMGAPSDCPPNEDSPNYMRHSEMLKMFRNFAEKFDITRHIQYNTEVTRVSKAKDYETSGRWIVQVKNNETGNITEDTFDAVVVCVGHIIFPKMPTFPGMEKFRGKIMHTHSLKRVDEFKDQKVVVVGIGCSGLDAAVEISNVAKQVYLSAKTGTWLIPRVGPNGLPFDFALLRRYWIFLQEVFGNTISSIFLEKVFLNKFDHELYNLKPEHHVLSKDPTVNDHLPCKIITGSVVLRKNIQYFTENGVLFDGEDRITEADSVIFATGYTWKFPFLDEGIVTTENGRINLYKVVFPVQLPHPTLSIIAFLLPYGPLFPLAELQCRWVSHLLAHDGRLPSTEVMTAEVKKRHETNLKRFTPSDKMTVRVDFIQYMDEIASEFGAKPNLLKMAFQDPKLFLKCIFGPCVPYQYRLEGPHSWPGAREAILTAYDRMKKPLSGTSAPEKSHFSEGLIAKYLLILLMASLLLTWVNSNVKYYLVALFLPYLLNRKTVIAKYLLMGAFFLFFVVWHGSTMTYFDLLSVPLIAAFVISV